MYKFNKAEQAFEQIIETKKVCSNHIHDPLGTLQTLKNLMSFFIDTIDILNCYMTGKTWYPRPCRKQTQTDKISQAHNLNLTGLKRIILNYAIINIS